MMYNNYSPRDEHWLCELFEDLLFMRTEEFMSKEDQKESKEYRLSERELQNLNELGIVNRIFRKWISAPSDSMQR